MHDGDRAFEPLADCRFWPLLQEPDLRPDSPPQDPDLRPDSPPIRQFTMKPAEVASYLQHVKTAMWMQDDVDLGEDCLVGPVDFTSVRTCYGPHNVVIVSHHHIDDLHWQALERVGSRCEADTPDIRDPPPPPPWRTLFEMHGCLLEDE